MSHTYEVLIGRTGRHQYEVAMTVCAYSHTDTLNDSSSLANICGDHPSRAKMRCVFISSSVKNHC